VGQPGAKGDPGTPGQSVATAAEDPGTNCAAGGVKLTGASGASYVCNGAPPATNHYQINWTAGTVIGVGTWTTLAGSQFTATTNGGDLLVFMSIPLLGSGSHSTCRPMIDGSWAGSYASLPLSPNEPYWTEGLVLTNSSGWALWAPTKLYRSIPAGSHTFSVQCATNTGTLTIGNAGTIGMSWGFTELR
jgi:hypothetical protein